MDGDFDIDVIIGNDLGDANQIYINNDGYYNNETPERLPLDYDFTTGLGLVDIDGDEDLDLIVSHAWGGDYGIYINNS